jgi:hypothetical protein
VTTRPVSLLVPALTVAAVIAGCGGGSGSSSSSVPKLGVSLAKSNAITAAGVDIFAAHNETANIVGHPEAVARGRQLLKPLIVAKTLKVGTSNPVAGGLVASIASQLDGVVPGLTTQSEKLKGGLVHSFLVHGKSDPKLVFEPVAASGVSRLERLLHGLRANTIVSDIGNGQTAAQEVASDVKDARPYWPPLTKRLEALGNSLR